MFALILASFAFAAPFTIQATAAGYAEVCSGKVDSADCQRLVASGNTTKPEQEMLQLDCGAPVSKQCETSWTKVLEAHARWPSGMVGFVAVTPPPPTEAKVITKPPPPAPPCSDYTFPRGKFAPSGIEDGLNCTREDDGQVFVFDNRQGTNSFVLILSANGERLMQVSGVPTNVAEGGEKAVIPPGLTFYTRLPMAPSYVLTIMRYKGNPALEKLLLDNTCSTKIWGQRGHHTHWSLSGGAICT